MTGSATWDDPDDLDTDPLPLHADARASQNLRSPSFQLPADDAVVEQGATSAQAMPNPVLRSAPAGNVADLVQPTAYPDDYVPPTHAAQRFARDQEQRHAQDEQQRQHVAHELNHADPYQAPDGRWKQRHADPLTGDIAEIDLDAAGRYRVDHSTGAKLIKTSAGDVEIGIDEPTAARSQLLADRRELRLQEQADDLAVAERRQALEPIREEIKAFGNTPRDYERRIATLKAGLGQRPDLAVQQRLDFEEKGYQTWRVANPRYAQLRTEHDKLAGENDAAANASLERRRKDLELAGNIEFIRRNGTLPPKPVIEPAPSAGPSLSLDDINNRATELAAARGMTQTRATRQILAEAQKSGVTSVGTMPIVDAISTANAVDRQSNFERNKLAAMPPEKRRKAIFDEMGAAQARWDDQSAPTSTAGNLANTAKQGLAEGFYRGVAGIVNAAVQFGAQHGWQPEALRTYGESVQGLRQGVKEAAPVNSAFGSSLGGQIARGFAELPGQLAPFAVPGGAVLGTIATLGASYQEQYDDAKAAGASDAKAHEAGMNAAPAGFFDALMDHFIIGKIMKPLRGKLSLRNLGGVIVKGLAGGATEGLQTAWQNFEAKYLSGFDPDRDIDQGVVDSIIVGGIVDATAATAGAGYNGYRYGVDATARTEGYKAAFQRAQDARLAASSAVDTNDPAALAKAQDEAIAAEAEMHAISREAIAADMDEEDFRNIGRIVGIDPDGPDHPLKHFATAEMGQTLREVYLSPEQSAALEKLGANTGGRKVAADQMVGQLAVRDLQRVLTGGAIDANKAHALDSLGLVETRTDANGQPSLTVTDDALALFPKPLREAITANPARFRFTQTPGRPGDGVATLARGGMQRVAETMGAAEQVSASGKIPPLASEPGAPSTGGNDVPRPLAVAADESEPVLDQDLDPEVREAVQGAEQRAGAGVVSAEPIPSANGESALDENESAGEVRRAFLQSRGLFDALGVGVPEVDANLDGPIAVRDGKVLMNPAEIAKESASLQQRGISTKAWLREALNEELIHVIQIEAERRAGNDWQQTYADIWNDPKLPSQLREGAHQAYVNFEQRTDAQKGAEVVRMVLSGRWRGTITERIFKAIDNFVNYLRGFDPSAQESELLRGAIERAERVLAEARKQGTFSAPVEAPEGPSIVNGGGNPPANPSEVPADFVPGDESGIDSSEELERLHREFEDGLRAEQADTHAETMKENGFSSLVDAITRMGGLPSKGHKLRGSYGEEIERVLDAMRERNKPDNKRRTGLAGIMVGRLFSESASSPDELATRLGYENANELFSALEDEINTGKPTWVAPEQARHSSDYDALAASRVADGPESSVRVLGNAILSGPGSLTLYASRAHHGTPHKVDRFSLEKIGTGEGAQTYGWGLYFAENHAVAREYAETLAAQKKRDYPARSWWVIDGETYPVGQLPSSWSSAKTEAVRDMGQRGYKGAREEIIAYLEDAQKAGRQSEIDYIKSYLVALEEMKDRVKLVHANFAERTYTVMLDVEQDELLDWDKPLSDQSDSVRAALTKAGLIDDVDPTTLGSAFYRVLSSPRPDVSEMVPDSHFEAGPMLASDDLKRAGIPGIRYLDQGSRDYQTLLDGKPIPEGNLVAKLAAEKLDLHESASKAIASLEKDPHGFSRASSLQAAALIRNGRVTRARPEGTYNYVIFDESKIKITHENGEPVSDSEAALHASSTGDLNSRMGTDEQRSPRASKETAKSALELARENIGLAVSIANQYRNIGAEMDDVVGEARVALIKAAQNFDPERAESFAGYAGAAIRNRLNDLFAKHRRQTGREVASLDAPLGEDGRTLGDNVPGDAGEAARIDGEREQSSTLLRETIGTLAERPRGMIEARMRGDTFDQIAAQFDLSNEGARKAVGVVMQHLRRILESKGLRGVSPDGVLHASSTRLPAEHQDAAWHREQIRELMDMEQIPVGKLAQGLYVLSDAQGTPIEVFDSQEAGMFHLDTMAGRGEWLWRVANGKKTELAGGVPERAARGPDSGPVGLYGPPADTSAETPAEAGEVPLYAPTGERFTGTSGRKVKLRWANYSRAQILGDPDQATLFASRSRKELPKLRPGEKSTGDLFQGGDAPFNLVGERGIDTVKRAEEKAAAERTAAEAKAKQDRDQGLLFASRVDDNGVHDLAKPRGVANMSADDRSHDPATALEALSRRDAGASTRERWKHGREIVSHSRLVAWAEGANLRLDPSTLPSGEGFAGGEHVVVSDPASGRWFKLTKPGLAGAHGEDAGAYLQRLALQNRVFNDNVRFEGVVTLPGESDARIVISQPDRAGRDSTAEEQVDYLRSRGFRDAGESRFVHPVTGLQVWDTITPGNAITAADGTVQPIDLLIAPASPELLAKVRRESGQMRDTLFASPTQNSQRALPLEMTPAGNRDFVDVSHRRKWWRVSTLAAIATQSAADVLERQKNPVSRMLAKALHRFSEERAEIEARLSIPFERTLQGVGRKASAQAKKEFERYYRLRENGSGKVADLERTRMSKAGQGLIKAWEIVANVSGKFAQRHDVQAWDPKLNEGKGGYRQGYWMGKDFFPRFTSDEVRRVIDDPDGHGALKARLVSEMVADGWNEEDANRYFEGDAPEILHRNDFLGQIEAARTAKLPESFYAYRFDDVVSRFIEGYSRRMGQIVSFGQKLKHSQTSRDLFDVAIEESRNDVTREYVAALQKQVYGISENSGWKRLTQNIRALATGTLLANPLTTVPRNMISGGLATAEMFGTLRSMRTLGAMIRGTVPRMTATQLGTIKANWIEAVDHADPDIDVSGWIRNFTNFTLKYSGYNASEAFVRWHATATAMQYATDFLAAAPNSTMAREGEAFMRRLGVDPMAVRAENGDFKQGKATRSFVRRAVKEAQFGYDASQVPVWANGPTGRLLYQFGRWGTQRTRTLWKHVFEPALLGQLVERDGKRYLVRNMKPLARVLAPLSFRTARVGTTAVVTGEIFAMIAHLLFDRDRDDTEWSEIAEDLSEDQKRGLAELFGRLGNDIMLGGMLGILSQPVDMARSWVSGARFKNPVEPPGFAVPRAAIEILRSWGERGVPQTVGDAAAGPGRDLWTAVRSVQPGVGAVADFGGRIAALVTDHVALFEQAEAQQRVKNLRKAARRFAAEEGLESGGGFDGRFTKRPETATYDRIQKALLIGDAESARKIIDDYVARKPVEQQEKAIKSIGASMRARQPIKVGAHSGEQVRTDFLVWAKKHLPTTKYVDFEQVQRTYEDTARAVGVMK